MDATPLLVKAVEDLTSDFVRTKAEREQADESQKKLFDQRLARMEAQIMESNKGIARQGRLALPGISVGSKPGEASWGRIAKICMAPSLMKNPEYGVEAEIYRQMQNNDDSYAVEARAAISAATGEAGGFLIPSNMMDQLVPQLREVSQARKLGITVLDNLSGEVYWNKSKGGITAQHLNTELPVAGAETVATFDQIRLAPRPIAAFVPISFQMRNQPPMALETWVQDEIVYAIGALEDTSIFAGSGANGAPRGVINHPSIQSLAFTALTYNGPDQDILRTLIQVVQLCRSANATNLGNLGWATSPQVLYHLAKSVDGQGRALFQSLNEGSFANAGPEQRLLRYPIIDTTFLTVGGTFNAEQMIFGPWKDVVLGHWGTLALSMSEETETNFRQGRATIRGIWQYDVGVFHGNAFVKGTGVDTTDAT